MENLEIRVHGDEDEVLRAVAELGRVVNIKHASLLRWDGRHTFCVWLKADCARTRRPPAA